MEPSLFAPPSAAQPLAARMRPRSLEEYAGQDQLLGAGKPLGEQIRRGDVGSMILWGPPGTGKTTLASLIARYTDREFVSFSAVTEGVPRVREIIREAEERLALHGRGTILFCDEIHRFNRGQQDAFLPHVERGTITLIGATTENPSFELTGALLSRCRVFVLEPLTDEALRSLIARALEDRERGLGGRGLTLADDALTLLVEQADGDARRALTVLEETAKAAGGEGSGGEGGRRRAGKEEPEGAPGGSTERPPGHAAAPRVLTRENVAAALARRVPSYDKTGEQHYNLISALHKAIRGSDADGALYWLARMIDGGEDPLYIARRVVRAAAEDIGLADPRALQLALAAKETIHFLGQPEGELALAEAVVYCATAPKSNRIYLAWGKALQAARETPAEAVPLHIRNAPTKLMKELGYGAAYEYAHDAPDGYVPQEYLPEVLRGVVFYEPTDRGVEREIAKRLEYWRARRRG